MVVPLSQVELGQWVEVSWIGSEESMAIRLLDLGFAPKEKICCVLKGKSGGMRAYLVRNAVIGLREQNIREIFVQLP
ncbi:MAG: FeoA family protein [Hungatella sp.]